MARDHHAFGGLIERETEIDTSFALCAGSCWNAHVCKTRAPALSGYCLLSLAHARARGIYTYTQTILHIIQTQIIVITIMCDAHAQRVLCVQSERACGFPAQESSFPTHFSHLPPIAAPPRGSRKSKCARVYNTQTTNNSINMA